MSVRERLEQLGAAKDPKLAALWLESLPWDEALREVSGRKGSFFRLQKARFLANLGRPEEALQALGEVGRLPPGLDVMRQECEAACRQGGRSASKVEKLGASGVASATLAELYATQGDVEAAVATYRQVLSTNPSNERARRRLLELTGRGAGRPEVALERLLERVRGWRTRAG